MQHKLYALFLVFVTFTASMYCSSETVAQNDNLHEPAVEWKKISSTELEIRWEKCADFSEATYHLFGAVDWGDLNPVALPQEFLMSSEASSSFLCSTTENSISIPHIYKYARIIALHSAGVNDVVTLMDLGTPCSGKSLTTPEGAWVGEKEIPVESPWSEILKEIAPYALPRKHPLRSGLDKIFSQSRVLASTESLKNAGFEILVHRQGRGMIVAKHRRLKGYLLKLYLDVTARIEWPLFVRRAKGARNIQQVIDENHFESVLKVPKKFIYTLPKKPIAIEGEGVFPKHFILLVEEMKLTDKETNRKYYKERVDYPLLRALAHTIEACGLSDSHVDNIPFSYDFRIAFIDTEYINSWPVHPEWITPFLSPKLRGYWTQLTDKQGNP